jgi:hypothetical protein
MNNVKWKNRKNNFLVRNVEKRRLWSNQAARH